MRKWILLSIAVLALAAVTVFILLKITGPKPGDVGDRAEKGGEVLTVTIATTKGDIVAELRGDLMPLTVDNFVKLAGKGFYDGLTFHRAEDWVIQGGDPKGNGTGGPGYSIKLETHPQLTNKRGAIAMARSAHPDSAGSQFYILRTDAPWLDGNYAVFGNVVSGMDVVDKIAVGDVMTKITVQPAAE